MCSVTVRRLYTLQHGHPTSLVTTLPIHRLLHAHPAPGGSLLQLGYRQLPRHQCKRQLSEAASDSLVFYGKEFGLRSSGTSGLKDTMVATAGLKEGISRSAGSVTVSDGGLTVTVSGSPGA